jgi:hypothetical protein
LFGGFSIYGDSNDQESNFEMKFRVKINGWEVLKEGQIVKCKSQEKHFYRYFLKTPIQVSAGTKIDITVWVAMNIESHGYISCYYGYFNNHNDESIPPGIFKVENGEDSINGTSKYMGQIPEIIYYLA